MSQKNGNGKGTPSEGPCITVRLAMEIEEALHITPASVVGCSSITGWSKLDAVITVGIAKLGGFQGSFLGIIADFNREGTPAVEAFSKMPMTAEMRAHDLLVRVAVATVATVLYDEMQDRLAHQRRDHSRSRTSERAGDGRPVLEAIDGGKGDDKDGGKRAAG